MGRNRLLQQELSTLSRYFYPECFKKQRQEDRKLGPHSMRTFLGDGFSFRLLPGSHFLLCDSGFYFFNVLREYFLCSISIPIKICSLFYSVYFRSKAHRKRLS